MIPNKALVFNFLGFLIVSLLVSACTTNSSNLVYRQSTVIGLDIQANPEGTSGKAVLGYDREVNAYVPKKPKVIGGKLSTQGQEAMSAISVSAVEIGFLEATRISESFATGDAAQALASKPNALNNFIDGAKKNEANNNTSSNSNTNSDTNTDTDTNTNSNSSETTSPSNTGG